VEKKLSAREDDPFVPGFREIGNGNSYGIHLLNMPSVFELSRVQLNISSPVMSEEYHAIWNSNQGPEDDNSWNMNVPFFSEGKRIGSMSLIGKSLQRESNFHWMADLTEGLRAFELQFSEIIHQELHSGPSSKTAEESQKNSESIAVESN